MLKTMLVISILAIPLLVAPMIGNAQEDNHRDRGQHNSSHRYFGHVHSGRRHGKKYHHGRHHRKEQYNPGGYITYGQVLPGYGLVPDIYLPYASGFLMR